MTCAGCQTEHVSSELAQNLCLNCLATQNTTFRLLLVHILTALKSGQVNLSMMTVTQEFPAEFLTRMEIALSVNTKTLDNEPNQETTPKV